MRATPMRRVLGGTTARFRSHPPARALMFPRLFQASLGNIAFIDFTARKFASFALVLFPAPVLQHLSLFHLGLHSRNCIIANSRYGTKVPLCVRSMKRRLCRFNARRINRQHRAGETAKRMFAELCSTAEYTSYKDPRY